MRCLVGVGSRPQGLTRNAALIAGSARADEPAPGAIPDSLTRARASAVADSLRAAATGDTTHAVALADSARIVAAPDSARVAAARDSAAAPAATAAAPPPATPAPAAPALPPRAGAQRGVADTVTMLPPVHVRQTRDLGPERSTATTVRLERSGVVRFQPATVNDALAAVPGVELVKMGPWASRVSMRGLSGERVLVMVDG